eukprot:8085-Chlamydomonas_euryale.AAC.3
MSIPIERAFSEREAVQAQYPFACPNRAECHTMESNVHEDKSDGSPPRPAPTRRVTCMMTKDRHPERHCAWKEPFQSPEALPRGWDAGARTGVESMQLQCRCSTVPPLARPSKVVMNMCRGSQAPAAETENKS